MKLQGMGDVWLAHLTLQLELEVVMGNGLDGCGTNGKARVTLVQKNCSYSGLFHL
jgi:hypothetical protein